jgi:hypothetical protein
MIENFKLKVFLVAAGTLKCRTQGTRFILRSPQ